MANKKIITTISERQLQEVGIRLEFDQITRAELMRAFIFGYIEDDPNIRKYVDTYKIVNKSKFLEQKKLIERLSGERAKVEGETSLNKKEIESLFDIFDEDFPE